MLSGEAVSGTAETVREHFAGWAMEDNAGNGAANGDKVLAI
jgi:hypothetical protein